MDPGYPKPITVWKGVPDAPQGAFVHKENGRRSRGCPPRPLRRVPSVLSPRAPPGHCVLSPWTSAAFVGSVRSSAPEGPSPQCVSVQKKKLQVTAHRAAVGASE